MISSKRLLIASSLIFAAGSFSAQAESLEINADAGFEVMHLSGSAEHALTYYGLRGSLEACDAKVSGFYLCGGVSGFTTLDKMSQAAAGGITKSSLNTLGGYVKTRTNLVEGWGFATYVGLSHFKFNHDNSVTGTVKENTNVIFTGMELDKQISGNISMSLKGEVGQTIDNDVNRIVYSFKPGVRVKF